MRIDSRELVAGVPMLEVRSLLRSMKTYGTPTTVGRIQRLLQCQTLTSAALLAELVKRGWLTQEQEGYRGEPCYQLTALGARLASASATKPLKRATAERIMGEFMERVHAVNASDYYLFTVSRVVVFGSYLTDSPTLSDIDLIVHLQPKEPDDELHEVACLDRTFEYINRGWTLSYLHIYGLYETMARREVLVALRNRNSYLAFHSSVDEVVIEDEPQKVVFGDENYTIPKVVRQIFGKWDD